MKYICLFAFPILAFLPVITGWHTAGTETKLTTVDCPDTTIINQNYNNNRHHCYRSVSLLFSISSL